MEKHCQDCGCEIDDDQEYLSFLEDQIFFMEATLDELKDKKKWFEEELKRKLQSVQNNETLKASH